MTTNDNKAFITSNKKDSTGNGSSSAPAAAALLPTEIHALMREEIDEDEVYTVLHGWGRVAPGAFHFVDETRFEDGIARNVSGIIVKRWMTGRRKDGEVAASRVYLQAVLSNEADEGDFARITGIELMPAQRLAAMIRASDLNAIFAALGPKDTAAIAHKLLELSGASSKPVARAR